MRQAVRLGALLAWLGVIVLARSGAAAPARILEPVTTVLASLVQSLVRWTGVEALRAGALLYVPGVFGYEIGIGCTGLLPAALVAVAILASPGTGAAKRRGLLVGVPLVLAVNLLRLAHLFYLGIHSPRLFALAHAVLWEGAIVLITFATWLAWSRWSAGLVEETAQ
jgi:exosortase/archaeosortase family protein